MSAIDEMYEKYGVNTHHLGCTNEDIIEDSNGLYAQDICEGDCLDCTWYDSDEYYPPFTAEKQLELIKYLTIQRIDLEFLYINKEFVIAECGDSIQYAHKDFGQALAGFLTRLRQKLDSKQCTAVKEILEK